MDEGDGAGGEQDVIDDGVYESVFGIDTDNAIIIDVIAIVCVVLAVIVIGIVLIYCCKQRRKYNAMQREESVEPNAVDAVHMKDKHQLSDIAPVIL